MFRSFVVMKTVSVFLLYVVCLASTLTTPADSIVEGPKVSFNIIQTLSGEDVVNPNKTISIKGYGGPDITYSKVVINVTNIDFAAVNRYNEVRVFLANENKQILEVRLNQTGQGRMISYEFPYKVDSDRKLSHMDSSSTEEKLWTAGTEITGVIIPKNVIYVSAAFVRHNIDMSFDYENYYSLFNSFFSLPDLMVVEEYLQLDTPLCPILDVKTTTPTY